VVEVFFQLATKWSKWCAQTLHPFCQILKIFPLIGAPSAWEDEVWCFSLFVTLVGRRLLWCIVELLPQDIESVFVGRFRCGLQRFLRLKSPFQPMEQFSKLSLVGATIGARMAEKKTENLRKWVQSLCAPRRPFISEMKEKYYHSILPHVQLMWTRIKYFANSLQGATKNCQLVAVVPKAHGRANVRLYAPKVY